MAGLVRLRARLERVADKAPKPTVVQPDLSYLAGWEIDRLREIGAAISGSAARDPEAVKEFEDIIAKCPPLPPGASLRLRPRFPSSLLNYWRRLASKDPRFPRGVYSASNLSYHANDRLQELAMQYGWDPDTDDTAGIADVDDWDDEDYAELIDLLWDALSLSERNLQGNGRFRESQ